MRMNYFPSTLHACFFTLLTCTVPVHSQVEGGVVGGTLHWRNDDFVQCKPSANAQELCDVSRYGIKVEVPGDWRPSGEWPPTEYEGIFLANRFNSSFFRMHYETDGKIIGTKELKQIVDNLKPHYPTDVRWQKPEKVKVGGLGAVRACLKGKDKKAGNYDMCIYSVLRAEKARYLMFIAVTEREFAKGEEVIKKIAESISFIAFAPTSPAQSIPAPAAPLLHKNGSN